MIPRTQSAIRERGQVVILAALLLPVLAGLGALALDLTYLYGQQQASQMAADAGAQAGAQAMAMGYSSTVGTADATQYVASNGFSSSNSTVQVNIPPVSPPALQTYGSGYVQVVIKLNLNPLLAGVLGLTGLKSTVEAVASEQDVFRNRALIYTLDHSAGSSLSTSGSNACLSVNGGIIVDSSSSTAISTQGGNSCTGSHITATSISEVGGATSNCCSPLPSTTPVAAPDPLGGVQMPQYSSGHWSLPDGTVLPNQTVTGTTLSPGVYTGGIVLSGGSYTMSPGIYVVDGGGFSLSGGVSVSGNGVFIYNTKSVTPSSCSPVSITGNGTITLKAPTSGPYRGLVLTQDRSCSTTASIAGNGSLVIDGGVYFADATLDLSGNGSQSGSGLQVLIVADKVAVAGNGVVQLAIPDSPHAPNIVGTVLVE
jgi:hypothetical protein